MLGVKLIYVSKRGLWSELELVLDCMFCTEVYAQGGDPFRSGTEWSYYLLMERSIGSQRYHTILPCPFKLSARDSRDLFWEATWNSSDELLHDGQIPWNIFTNDPLCAETATRMDSPHSGLMFDELFVMGVYIE